MRISDAWCDRFRRGPGKHEFHKVACRLSFVGTLLTQFKLKIVSCYCFESTCKQLSTHQLLLKSFVNHKVNNSFWYSEITRRDSFVEASKSVCLIDPLNALADIHFAIWIVVQLKSCLNKPDWICRCWWNKASAGCAQDVWEWRISGKQAVD